MFSNQSKYQSQYGEIKQSYAYEKFYFKGETKGIALKYVKQGYEDYLINDQVLRVKQGQFILVPEGQKFEAKSKLASQSIHGLCIDLNPTALDIDLAKMYANPLLFNLPFDCLHFSPLVKKLHTTHSNKDNNSELYQTLTILNEQVHSFAKEITGLHERLSVQSRNTDTQRAILIKMISCKNFIYQHFNQKITLDQLATYTGISKYHFSRLFKLCFQESPQELQEKLRMDKAIELLQNNTMQLNTIAYDLGYHDLASFSKKFKNYYDISPSERRKMTN